jgi:uncharacterized protein (DUF2141 family)
MLFAAPAAATQRADLMVHVGGLRNSDGQVLCALFDKADAFPDGERALQGGKVKVSERRATCQLKGLSPGRYAVAVFHDEDGDGEMDTFLGIPTEGFGFSNNAKPSTFGPPSFSDAAFKVDGKIKRKISIRMRYL